MSMTRHAMKYVERNDGDACCDDGVWLRVMQCDNTTDWNVSYRYIPSLTELIVLIIEILFALSNSTRAPYTSPTVICVNTITTPTGMLLTTSYR